MKIHSWNVNGIRAIYKKGVVDYIEKENPDILCVQEIKANPEDIPSEILELKGYTPFVSSAEKKGYSGVLTLSKIEFDKVEYGFGIDRFDYEGRIIAAYFDKTVIYNIYFPNGKMKDRLKYKMDFYEEFLKIVKKKMKEGLSIIVCGDLNTAHNEIDLARPKENENVSGFLPIEREWMDRFISAGFIDSFRLLNKERGNYSWWDYKTRARERNIGWRIDYIFISEDLKEKVKKAYILNEHFGSDHCPVGVEIEILDR